MAGGSCDGASTLGRVHPPPATATNAPTYPIFDRTVVKIPPFHEACRDIDSRSLEIPKAHVVVQTNDTSTNGVAGILRARGAARSAQAFWRNTMKIIKPMVEVRIHYCVPCGYLGFAAEIAQAFFDEGGDQVAALLVPGLHGILQVEIAKTVVYDKLTEDQIPTPPRIRECRAILRANIDEMNAVRAAQLAANGGVLESDDGEEEEDHEGAVPVTTPSSAV
jgi:predicted Rdx family selenoprotein